VVSVPCWAAMAWFFEHPPHPTCPTSGGSSPAIPRTVFGAPDPVPTTPAGASCVWLGSAFGGRANRSGHG
jgi:hypothetical protein